MESVIAESVPDDAAKTDVEAAKNGDEGSAPSAPKAGTSEDTSSWTEKAQKRYDELTRRAYEAQAERDRERYQRESLEARLAELQKAKTEPVAPENFPTLEQFGYDEGKFNAAVAAHFSKIATEQGKTAAQEALKAERERQAKEQAVKSWATKEAEFIKSKPEYVDKVQRASSLPISEEIQRELLDSEYGPQVALYLVDNREKALAIMQLPLAAQLREIGRIEARLEASKATPPVSQAPPPVKKVESDDAVIEKTPADMTDTEFAKWRKKQIAARRNA